jgi:GUN4-like protein
VGHLLVALHTGRSGGYVALFQRFVLGVDVQRFSERTMKQQREIQRALNRILDEAAESAGISRTRWERREEGDGETAVLPEDVDLAAAVRTFVSELDWRLTDHNEDHQPAMHIRLRVAMHFGAIADGSLGYVSQALTELKRLLDSKPVRRVLIPQVNLAQIISERLYQEVVLPGLDGIKPSQFQEVLVDMPEKAFRRIAYVYVPINGFVPPEPARNPPPHPPKSSQEWTQWLASPTVTPLPGPPKEPGQSEPGPGPEASASASPESPELTAEVRALVRDMREALTRNEVGRADALTTSALLEAAGRRGYLRESDGDRLPDRLLTEIDSAWAEFSDGAWGFQAQRKSINGRVLSRKDFRELSVMLGWRDEQAEPASPYSEFAGRADYGRPFYPTLRLPEREWYPRWPDEWAATAMSVHVRLQRWEG